MRSERFYAQNAVIIVLAIAVMVMSVGYAVYSTNLSITGTVNVEETKWSVYFANPTVKATSLEEGKYTATGEFNLGTDPNNSLHTNTQLSYSAEMSIHDKYSFVVDVVNAGTFDAKLVDFELIVDKDGTQEVVKNKENSYSNAYMDYSVQWLTTSGSNESTSNLAVNEILGKRTNSTTPTVKKLLVTVETHEPDNEEDLPVDGAEYTFTFKMDYDAVFKED